jgi:Lipocalin-like domain
MKRRNIVGLSMVAALGLALLPAGAVGQQKSLKDQLAGAWTHVSTKYKFPDGKTADTMGPNARGIMILDASGHMAFINMRASLPKFTANDRTKGTAEENKAIVNGSYAYFGTYTVNEADHSFTVHVEGSTFPNFDGIDQKRSITLAGDELRYTNPVATIGQGVVVEAVWKRAK